MPCAKRAIASVLAATTCSSSVRSRQPSDSSFGPGRAGERAADRGELGEEAGGIRAAGAREALLDLRARVLDALDVRQRDARGLFDGGIQPPLLAAAGARGRSRARRCAARAPRPRGMRRRASAAIPRASRCGARTRPASATAFPGARRSAPAAAARRPGRICRSRLPVTSRSASIISRECCQSCCETKSCTWRSSPSSPASVNDSVSGSASSATGRLPGARTSSRPESITATILPGLSGRQSVSGTTACGSMPAAASASSQLRSSSRRSAATCVLPASSVAPIAKWNLLDFARERLLHRVGHDLRELGARLHGQFRPRERHARAGRDDDDLSLLRDRRRVGEVAGRHRAETAAVRAGDHPAVRVRRAAGRGTGSWRYSVPVERSTVRMAVSLVAFDQTVQREFRGANTHGRHGAEPVGTFGNLSRSALPGVIGRSVCRTCPGVG